MRIAENYWDRWIGQKTMLFDHMKTWQAFLVPDGFLSLTLTLIFMRMTWLQWTIKNLPWGNAMVKRARISFSRLPFCLCVSMSLSVSFDFSILAHQNASTQLRINDRPLCRHSSFLDEQRKMRISTNILAHKLLPVWFSRSIIIFFFLSPLINFTQRIWCD